MDTKDEISLSRGEAVMNTFESPPAQEDQSPQTLRLSDILRRAGGAVLVVASIVFLFQRWDALDQLTRYFSFLGFTGAIAALGIFCAVRLCDDKAARTLLLIALLAIPIHFAQLGGLVYSAFPESFAITTHYPQYFRWIAPSGFAALGTTLIGFLFLLPITYFAFRVFTGKHAGKLTALLLGSSAVLLLPFRHPDFVGWLGMFTLMVATVVDSVSFRPKKELATFEGKVARALVFLPTILLLTRTVYLYSGSSLFVGAVLGGVGIICFVVAPSYSRDLGRQSAFQIIGVVPLVISTLITTNEIVHAFQVAYSFLLLFYALSAGGILLLCSRFAVCGRTNYETASVLVVVPLLVGNELLFPITANVLLSIVAAIAALSAGFSLKRATMYYTGVLGLAVILVHHLRLAIDFSEYSPWAVLAGIGLLTVLFSSCLERHSTPVRDLIQRVVFLRPKGAEKVNAQ